MFFYILRHYIPVKKNAAMFLMIVSIFMSLSYSSYQIVCLTISQTTRYQIINQNTCKRIIIKWNYFYECSNQNKICLLLYPFSNLVEHACNFKQRHFNNKLVILMTFFHFKVSLKKIVGTIYVCCKLLLESSHQLTLEVFFSGYTLRF